MANGGADLINARVKQAQINGAQPGDPVYQDAITSAKRDALKTQVQAIGATDPSTALRILEKNKTLADTDYPALYADLKDKADKKDGLDFSTSFLAAHKTQTDTASAGSITNPAQPIYRQAATDIPGGMSPTGLARTVQIESGGNPDITNASGHVGLGQFSADTWKDVGLGGDPTNPTDSILAIQRYAASNAKYLTPILGRPPTDAELYLAHQQGPGGAAKLLANPNAKAADLIGIKAVTQNGGTADMTAYQYVSMWTKKFNGTVEMGAVPRAQMASGGGGSDVQAVPPPSGLGVAQPPPSPPPATPAPSAANASDALSPPSAKASAYQAIQAAEANGELTPQAAQYAYDNVNRMVAAQQIADDATAAAKKQLSDQSAGKYMTQILNGGTGPDLLNQIANDPALEWETKDALTKAAQGHAEDSAAGATAAYGPGFWKAYQQVSAEPGDPSRVADAGSILRRAGPGGDLTLAGAQKLLTVMGQNTRSVDDNAVNQSKIGLLAYAKQHLSFEQDTGPVSIKDPEGEALFNGRFIPKFEASYDQWIKDGKDPWQFLTQDNVDKMIAGLRSPREMALARLQAEQGVDASTLSAPPTPQGVDDEGWKLVMTAPPVFNGAQLPPDKWQAIVQRLVQSPTPQMMKGFDDAFSAEGVKASDLIDILGVKPVQGDATQSAPATAPETPPAVSDANEAVSAAQAASAATNLEATPPSHRAPPPGSINIPPPSAPPVSEVPPSHRPPSERPTADNQVPKIPDAIMSSDAGVPEDQMPKGYSEWKNSLPANVLQIYKDSVKQGGSLEKRLQEAFYLVHPVAQ